MMGINSYCKLLIAAMFSMQNIAKRPFPSFSEHLRGVVTKGFLGLCPRPPHALNILIVASK